MNYKAIIFYLGLFIFPLSGLAFINILYSTYFDYFLSINTYFTTLAISLLLKYFSCIFLSKGFFPYSSKCSEDLLFCP